MNIWKPTEKNAFSQISRLSEGLSNNTSHAAIQKMISIFNNLFQSYNQSHLSNLYQEAFIIKNKDWKKTFICAVDLFGPNSQIGKTIILYKDFKIDIDNFNYSSDFESYLRKSEMTNSGISRRQQFSFKIPMLECFFAQLALCLLTLRDQERKIDKWETGFYEDQIFFYFTRNPILVIMKNWLTYTKHNYDVYTRVLKILELIILKDVTNQLRKKQRMSIKCTIIHAIYVISEWRVGTYHFEALQIISENLQKKSNNANLLTLWIRLNLAFLLNSTQLQEKARQDMRRFDMKQPAFSSLSRNYFESKMGLQELSFKGLDNKAFLNFLFRIETLVNKNFWEISPSFLQMLFILITITQKVVQKRQQQAFKIRFLNNIFKNGVVGLTNYQNIQLFQKIKKYYDEVKGDRQFEDESENEQVKQDEENSRKNVQKNQRQIRLRKSLKIHQGDLSKINQWRKPLQPSQSLLLLQGSKWIAKQIDKCRRTTLQQGKQDIKQHPRTNIRFLASPFNILILLLVIILPTYWIM